MKYFTKEWYALCLKTFLAELLEDDDRAAKKDEEFYNELLKQRLGESLAMQDEIAKMSDEDISIGDLTFSSSRNEILCGGRPVKLTRTELKMLSYMMKNPEKAYSRDELLNAIWGYDTKVETRVTDETLRRIRKQLSACESNVSVRTMWGFGYRIEVNGDKK